MTPSLRSTAAQRLAARSMLLACVVLSLGVAGAAARQSRDVPPPVRFVDVPSGSPETKAPETTASNGSKPVESPTPRADETPISAAKTAKPHKIVWMDVTAYCPCPKCCGAGAHGVTASGKPVTFNDGHFAAAPKSLHFGTQLRVPGYNSGQPIPVLDRGGVITGNRLDVFFPTHEQAKAWGRQRLAVEVE